MAKKLYDIEEAAAVLGVTAAQLSEMRSRNEIRGFRDGTTWKFKPEEVEELAAEMQAKAAKAADEDGGIGIGNEPEGPAEGGSVLLSERELGSGPTTSSTIIGKSGVPVVPDDSDIRLADVPPPKDHAEVSDVKLADAGSKPAGGSAIKPASGSDLKLSGSGVKLSSGSDILRESGAGSGAGSDIGLQFEELDSLELDFEDSKKPAGGQVKPPASAPVASKATDSNLGLADESPSASGDAGTKTGSDVGGSALDLSGDDDLVLGGSGSGSDVTGKPGDSGISLMDPSDSGLSLDEPLELGGSAIDGGSLVLGEDDMITLGGDADRSAATQMRSDDDFLLTPGPGLGGDESESGSQVIALDSEGYDQESATQVAGSAAMRMLEEDITNADTMVGGPGMIAGGGVAVLPGMQPAAVGVMAPAIPEAPYSIWNVMGLFVCVAMLCFLGMIMYDMTRHLWSFGQPYHVNSSLMDAIVDMFKK